MHSYTLIVTTAWLAPMALGQSPPGCARFLKAGDIVRAEQCATGALQRSPDPATLQQAIEIYRHALTAKGATPERVYNLALALFRNQEYRESLQLLSKYPSDAAENHALAGNSLRALNDFPRALLHLREASRREPGSEDYRYDYLLMLLQTGDEQTARTELESALNRFPRSAKLIAIRGMIAYANGQNVEAVESYRKAVSLEPNAADLHASLGDVYSATGDLQQAAASYAAATRLQPNEAEYHVKEGRNLMKLQRTEDAARAFRRALLRDSSEPEANYELGKLAAAESKDAEAIRYLEAAVRSTNVRPEAYYQLGRVYRRVGRNQDAAIAMKHFQERKATGEEGKQP